MPPHRKIELHFSQKSTCKRCHKCGTKHRGDRPKFLFKLEHLPFLDHVVNTLSLYIYYPLPNFDHRYDISGGSSGTGLLGVALLSALCKMQTEGWAGHYSNSHVEDSSMYVASAVAAHELGHK